MKARLNRSKAAPFYCVNKCVGVLTRVERAAIVHVLKQTGNDKLARKVAGFRVV